MTTFDESLDAHEGFSTDDVRIFSADSANTGVFSSAREAWEFRAFIAYMTKRDLRTTYTRSYLGWAWSLLNPIAEVIIYSIVFGFLLDTARAVPDAPNGFNSFPHFLISGIAIFGFFRAVSSKILNQFMATVRLRRKLYFPPVAAALSTTLSTLVEASILVFVVIGFFAVVGHISIHALVLIPASLFAATMGLGVGLALSVVNSRYKDVSYIYNLVLRLAFYLLPIIWPIEQAAGRFGDIPFIEGIVSSNPLAKVIGFGRDGILFMRWPPLVDWIYLSAASGTVLLIGWMIFARSSADVAEGL